MRINHLLIARGLAGRTVGTEIDREARKCKPLPSDRATLVIDLDEAGHPFNTGCTAAEGRIAGRRAR
jgi:exodeoxyribonuclease-3